MWYWLIAASGLLFLKKKIVPSGTSATSSVIPVSTTPIVIPDETIITPLATEKETSPSIAADKNISSEVIDDYTGGGSSSSGSSIIDVQPINPTPTIIYQTPTPRVIKTGGSNIIQYGTRPNNRYIQKGNNSQKTTPVLLPNAKPISGYKIN